MSPRKSLKRDIDGQLKSSESKHCIVVAVDFGTTCSGLVYAYTADPSECDPITTWPDPASEGCDGMTREKVPTVLRYTNNKVEWGCQVLPSKPHHKWFKLDLDPQGQRRSRELAALLRDQPSPAAESDITPEQKVTDYPAALQKHVELFLQRSISSNVLHTTQIRYILTVPAVWSDTAKAKTETCAGKAGMGCRPSLQLVSEPEAAAVYAVKKIRYAKWKIGENFVLVDAGGGTVDLISYQVTQLEPSIEVDEACPGTGNIYGSIFINDLFQKKLTELLSSEAEWHQDILDGATDYFENVVKPMFSGRASGETFRIPVPGLKLHNRAKGISHGKLEMSAETVSTFFEPVIRDMLRLVLKQVHDVKGPVSKILLVGGLGQSAYIRERIRQEIGDIEVLQPGNGRLAVVKGALMRGIERFNPNSTGVSVRGRKARKHYGLLGDHVFNSSIHNNSRKHWDSADGLYRISVIEWFLKKDTTVEEKKPVVLHYYQDRPVEQGRPGVFEVDVLVCDDPDDEGPPMYKDDGVEKLVTLKANLGKVPIKQFPKFTGKDRAKHYKIIYEVHITYLSASMKYELVHNGKNYGAVEAEYV